MSINIINCDELIGKDNKHTVKNHVLMPQVDQGVGSYRWSIIGKAGCGKTNSLVSIILSGYLKFDRLWLVSHSVEQPKYKLLTQYFNTLEKEMEKECGERVELLKLITTTTDIPTLEDINSDLHHVFIFDDMLLDKDQSKMEEFFVRGRHRNCSVIYISQSFFDTPKLVRKNSEYWSIFSCTSNKELRSISDSMSVMCEYSEFKNMFQKATEEPNSFLFIDLRTDMPILKVRKGFDGIWVEEENDFFRIEL